MKRCPTCQTVYADDTLRFCLDDGAPLITESAPVYDSGATLVSPTPGMPQTHDPYRPSSSSDQRTSPMDWRAPQTGSAYAPPTQPTYPIIPPGTPPQQRSSLPLIIGGLLVVFFLGVVAIGAFVAWRVAQRPSTSTTTSRSTTPSKASKTIVVAKLGGGDYTSINEALKNAVAGARISVRPGVYNESLELNKRVEIVGDGPISQVVVDTVDANCISMKTDSALVRGLTLRNRSTNKDSKYYAVSIGQGELTLEDCDITSSALTAIGIFNSGTRANIRRCRVHDCLESGMYFYDNARGTVEDCDVFNNGYANISIKDGADPTIKNSRIYNGKSSGVYSYKDGKGTVEDSRIYGNAYSGVSISEGGDPFINRCKINNNGYNAVYVYKNGKGTVQNSDLTGNKQSPWDIEAGSTVRRSGNTE